MNFLKLLLGFAPWISFLIIAQGSMFRLKVGLVVALVLSVIIGVTRLHRGVILWVGLAFFTYASVAVVMLDDMWTAQHMGILANGALAACAWLTIAFKKPFTLDYARDHTDPTLWDNPVFIRTNIIITSVWAAAFTANTILAWGKMIHFILPEWAYEVCSYSLLIAAVAYTTWYPAHIRRARQRQNLP